MTKNNSLDVYDNEGRWVHSEEHRKEEERLMDKRRQITGDFPYVAQAEPTAQPATSEQAAPRARRAPRKPMALDMKVCLAVLAVCVIILALMAHW